MPTCEEIKTYLRGQLAARARDAGYAGDAMRQAVAMLADAKAHYCDTADPIYNPTCCSTFSAKLDAIQPQFKDNERTLMLQQQCTDAIAAIDCGAPDWQARVAEAADQIQGLTAWIAEQVKQTTLLLAWLAAIEGTCPLPVTADTGGGD